MNCFMFRVYFYIRNISFFFNEVLIMLVSVVTLWRSKKDVLCHFSQGEYKYINQTDGTKKQQDKKKKKKKKKKRKRRRVS